MNFLEFCNSILENVLLESMHQSDILKIHSEISELEKKYRAKDKPTFKNELKKIKKAFVSKLVKENHKSIMDKFFPFLKEHRLLSERDFSVKFYAPETWENIQPEQFDLFLKDVEGSIDFFSSKQHSRFSNLRFLSNAYIRY